MMLIEAKSSISIDCKNTRNVSKCKIFEQCSFILHHYYRLFANKLKGSNHSKDPLVAPHEHGEMNQSWRWFFSSSSVQAMAEKSLYMSSGSCLSGR